MIILKHIREKPLICKKKYIERFIENSDTIIDEIILLDSSLRQNLEKQQKLQEERNKISKTLSSLLWAMNCEPHWTPYWASTIYWSAP